MKKLFWAVPVLALGLLVAGCGKSGASQEKNNSKELVYWQHSSPARDTEIKKIAKDFEKKNPGVKVRLEFIPEADYSQKLVTSLASGDAPDVFQVQSGMIAKLVKAKSVQSLESSVISSSDIKSDYIASTVDPLQVDGKYYGLPTDTQSLLTFTNTDLAKKYGFSGTPATWKEFFNRARKMTKTKDGKVVQSGWGVMGYSREVESFVVQNGGKMYDADKKQFVFADDPKAMDAIKEYSALYRTDKVFSTDMGANWQSFRQGLIGQMLGHPAMLGNLPETAPNLKFKVGLLPAVDGKHTSAVTSWAYTASTKAPSKLASKFIAYLSSKDVQKQWTLKTGELPTHKSLLKDKDILADPNLKIALQSLDDSFSCSLQTASLVTIWDGYFEKVMHTNDSIDKIMEACQKDLNADLNKDL